MNHMIYQSLQYAVYHTILKNRMSCFATDIVMIVASGSAQIFQTRGGQRLSERVCYWRGWMAQSCARGAKALALQLFTESSDPKSLEPSPTNLSSSVIFLYFHEKEQNLTGLEENLSTAHIRGFVFISRQPSYFLQ